MKRKKQISLPNGCWCSSLTINPKNWETGGDKTLSKPWYVSYRFYDPQKPDQKGNPSSKLRILKGMNDAFTHRERVKATRLIIDSELTILREQGYNPITNEFRPEVEFDSILSERTPLHKALNKAAKTVSVSDSMRDELKVAVKYVTKSIYNLRLHNLEVGETRIKHIRAILDNCANIKEIWNANQFNVYRKDLLILFSELIEQGAAEQNPVREIKVRDYVSMKVRTGIPSYERRRIDEHLRRKKLTSFRLFLRIFFSSGARITELLGLQRDRVNLVRQTYTVLIKKGRKYKMVTKTIPTHALRYWKLLCKTAGPEHYIFSVGLIPGPQKIRTEQIKRRWATHVRDEKTGISLKKDIYEFKHTHTTEVVDNHSDDHAAAINSHTTKKLVHGVYDLKHDQRKHEELKKVKISFV